MDSLSQQIEALLFYKNEPVSLQRLCAYLDKNENEVKQGLMDLKINLGNRGLSLVEQGDQYMLATASATSPLLDKVAKEELSKELGKAGLETLAIILYKGQASRREIDYIRGVNSTFILRNLMARGLVERKEGQQDARIFSYGPTLALLAHLGLNRLEALPEYEKIREQVGQVLEHKKEDENI